MRVPPLQFFIPLSAIPSFNCIDGECVDPNDGTGIYSSLEACRSDCGSFDCEDGECMDPGDGTGEYDTMDECLAACVESYDCVDGECTDPGDGTGEFETLEDCQDSGCEDSCPPDSAPSHVKIDVDETFFWDYASGPDCTRHTASELVSFTVEFDLPAWTADIGLPPNNASESCYIQVHATSESPFTFSCGPGSENPTCHTGDEIPTYIDVDFILVYQDGAWYIFDISITIDNIEATICLSNGCLALGVADVTNIDPVLSAHTITFEGDACADGGGANATLVITFS